MSFSDKFLEIMNSRLRPKCEPKITVTGTAADGTTKTVEWNAKDIKGLTYHRSIDPTGRELPTMELQWTEIYYGKFNSNNFPIKYNNVSKYMTVNLEFHQFLGFYQTWKTLKSMTWKQVKALTWEKVKNEVAFETVKMPMMFLSATPEISGHTIKWTAKDALSFLTVREVKGFGEKAGGAPTTEIPYYNPIVYMLINARAGFYYSIELFDYLTRTINYFNGLDKTAKLKHSIIFDGAVNSELMNYLSPNNEYLDFDSDKIIKKKFTASRPVNPEISVPLDIQYGQPEVSYCKVMSLYNYKEYIPVTTSNENAYTLSPQNIKPYTNSGGKNYYYYNFIFQKYGLVLGTDAFNTLQQEINRAVGIAESNNLTLSILPLEFNTISHSLKGNYYDLGTQGEVYEEDNHLNAGTENEMQPRAAILSEWFADLNKIVNTTTPALFNWGIGEWAKVETTLWQDEENRFIAYAQLIETTITYNGTIKQNNIAHSVQAVG